MSATQKLSQASRKTFCAWIDSVGGVHNAAELLGVSVRTISNYKTGHHPMPRMVELACLYIDQDRVRAWRKARGW